MNYILVLIATVLLAFEFAFSRKYQTMEGTAMAAGLRFNLLTGLFTTVPSQIVVPAATYTQDPVTGAYTVTPGIATLVVTGTI